MEQAVEMVVDPPKLCNVKIGYAWVAKYAKRWGWSDRDRNTAGTYLAYNDDKMRFAFDSAICFGGRSFSAKTE